MLNKNDVNGPQACDLFRFLRANSSLYDERKRQAGVIPWNFAKFLVDSNGKVSSYHAPRENPLSLRPQIDRLLSP